MNEAQQLYPILLDANKRAFACQLFSTAYHVLSGAMHCGVLLKDANKLYEVEQLAREQHEALSLYYCESSPTKEPVELSLYISLLQIVRTRLLLLSK